MKFVFAILVQLVLFTEGNENRDVRHTNQKNHKLNMKRLLNPAVLLKDQPAPSLMPPVSFKFPVEVDLTELESMLEKRFAVIDMIQNQLAVVVADVSTYGDRFSAYDDRISSVESKATTNENKIGNLTSSGLSSCEVGTYFTSGHAGGVIDERKTVFFKRNFTRTPQVIASVQRFYGEKSTLRTDAKTSYWGCMAAVKSPTTTEFKLSLTGHSLDNLGVYWIACS